MTQLELDWIKAYIDGERENNDELIDKKGKLVKHKYTLYDVPMHDVKLSPKNIKLGFSTFLKRSIQAKANIG